jgi:hypothetical protein
VVLTVYLSAQFWIYYQLASATIRIVDVKRVRDHLARP